MGSEDPFSADNQERFQHENVLKAQDEFDEMEVGITHPRTDAFVKLTNQGDIHIVAGDNLGIILNPTQGTMTLLANKVRVLSNKDDGMQWNGLSFNSEAYQFQQPTFRPVQSAEPRSIYRGVESFTPDPEEGTDRTPIF